MACRSAPLMIMHVLHSKPTVAPEGRSAVRLLAFLNAFRAGPETILASLLTRKRKREMVQASTMAVL